MQNEMLQGSQYFFVNENEYDNSFLLETEKTESDSEQKNEVKTKSPPQKVHGTYYYEITSDKSFMKCMKYYLKKDGQVIYTAKVKDDEIYINEGPECHISDNQVKKGAKIKRFPKNYNMITTNDQEIKVTFIEIGHYNSMNISFKHNGRELRWIPRLPRSMIGFYGGYWREPIPSKKNTILQNTKYHPSFICRRMSKKVFEAECNKEIDPVIVFSIALSQIIGPLLK